MHPRIRHGLMAVFFPAIVPLTDAASANGSGEVSSFDAAIARATLDYAERLRVASEELAALREKIGSEKAPLLQELRRAEDRIIAADTEHLRLETAQEESLGRKRRLLQDIDARRKTIAYLATLSHDALKGLQTGLRPGEDAALVERLADLERQLGATADGPNLQAAFEAADLMATRTESALGGEIAEGSAVHAGTGQLVRGKIARVGPESFFLPDREGAPGVLRPREESRYPTLHPLERWRRGDAEPLFMGNVGVMFADASGGKALRLQQISGTYYDHVRKGGVIAYLIVGVGVLALAIVIGKLVDLVRMKVDSRDKVREFLAMLAVRSSAQAETGLASLQPTTRELFAEGLRHRHEPKAILEERLQSVLLGQRMHFERRLPLLAVIATAAPLMGLLGTVVGMVKTFALITVFGTGNAAKLSSGISEVLVATELGLAVAIPALVVHGFIAHRVHKNLALLERHALDFLTAAELAKLRKGASDEKPALV